MPLSVPWPSTCWEPGTPGTTRERSRLDRRPEERTRLALTVWRGRISPVLDSCSELLLVDVDAHGREVRRRPQVLVGRMLLERVRELGALGVDALICGALSTPLARALARTELTLVPWIHGEVEEVLRAFLQGEIHDHRFRMPGCRGGTGRRRRCFPPHRRGHGKGRPCP